MKNKTQSLSLTKSILTGVAIGLLASGLPLLFSSKNELSGDSKTVVTPNVPLSAQESFKSTESKTKEIKTLTLNKNRTILLQEIITDRTERLADEILEMGDGKEPIVILIDSPGGSVFSGEKIVSAIESVNVEVYTVCIGMCASMAAIIHQYGTKRLATDRSVLMFHDAAGMVGGRVSEMLSLLSMIKRKIDKSNHYIANRSKMSYDELVRLESSNFWIDAEDSIEKGLVDGLVRIKR